jgi:transposase
MNLTVRLATKAEIKQSLSSRCCGFRARPVATRYDKLAANYLAFDQLASIRLWLRVNESTP